MNNFFDIFLHDPVMLAGGAVFAGTIIILLWALKTLNEPSAAPEEVAYEDIPQENSRENENSGLTEARLQAIVNQLNDISQRLTNIEKTIAAVKPSDQTIPMLMAPAKIDEAIKRLEAKLDAISTVKLVPSGQPTDISALEAKLDGIHKLLIYLTDSGK